MSPSDSRPDAWRRFAKTLLATALLSVAVLYGFVVIVDPWDALPLSPPLPRVPISTNARFSFPALARSPRFDSAVVGSSTSRLLQPAMLDQGFSAHFVNLAMNAATAYEQEQILGVFLRAHPQPRVILVGLDVSWCTTQFAQFTPRQFPAWMYGGSGWAGYLHMLTPYAVQEAANQFAVMTHMKRRRYGLDGYTRFVPPDQDYDTARRDAAFRRWEPVDNRPAPEGEAVFPPLALLRDMLGRIPARTRKILFFVPYYVERQGGPGGAERRRWDECKLQVAAIASGTGAEVMDFMIPSAITRDKDHYWDPIHYREPIAARVVEGLVAGRSPDAAVLMPR